MNVFIVKKVLGNNVIFANKGNKNYILTGKGIGFGKKIGDKITPKHSIEKIFMEHVDKEKEVADITEEIIELAEKALGERLNQHIHVDLLDHINFAIYRIQEKMDIVNPFLMETQILYKEEFSIAQKAAKILENKLKIKIPDTEIGFITLHVHSARKNCKVTQTLKETRLLKSLVEIIEKELDIILSPLSAEYSRLITHLKYAIERIEKDRVVINLVLDRLKDDLYNEYKIAVKISQEIGEYLGKNIPEDEIGYIALHLYRLKNYTAN